MPLTFLRRPGSLPAMIFVFLAGISDSVSQTVDTNAAYVVIDSIRITGNKNTWRSIVLRELNYKEGDTVGTDVLKPLLGRGRENILNTSLFNFVEVDWEETGKGHILVKIDVKERHYLWPIPIFENADRNFNEWWEKKDIRRTNYGFYLNRYNCRGRNETLQFMLRLGYSQKFSVSYHIPFFLKNESSGLAVSASWLQKREIAFGAANNTLQFYKDPDRYVRTEFACSAVYLYRAGLYSSSNFEVYYKKNVVADTVAVLNPDYFREGTAVQQYVGLSWFYRNDHRDLKAYPLHGYYYDLEIVKKGIISQDINALFAAGSVRKYGEFSNRLFWSCLAKGKWSGYSYEPFFNQSALGYGTTYMRGYEYYVIDGQHYALLKANLKYTLVNTRITKVGYIPWEKFNTIPYTVYFNLYADAGYVHDGQNAASNPLANRLLRSAGAGIDYVSYYNIVFRAEYSVILSPAGGRFGEHGIFLHFASPI